jgi:hypothetical protein
MGEPAQGLALRALFCSLVILDVAVAKRGLMGNGELQDQLSIIQEILTRVSTHPALPHEGHFLSPLWSFCHMPRQQKKHPLKETNRRPSRSREAAAVSQVTSTTLSQSPASGSHVLGETMNVTSISGVADKVEFHACGFQIKAAAEQVLWFGEGLLQPERRSFQSARCPGRPLYRGFSVN